jgi:uncharacterized protein YjeT (DUF2065 family)
MALAMLVLLAGVASCAGPVGAAIEAAGAAALTTASATMGKSHLRSFGIVVLLAGIINPQVIVQR